AHAQVLVVANKVQPAVSEISKVDFEASIETKIDLVIPYDIKAASNAAKLGQTFADANRSSKASVALRNLGQMILNTGDRETAVEVTGGKKSLLGKLDLKSMLSKKDKAPSKEQTHKETSTAE
ncbi:MAG: pilus assembly protein CpaE, partial [Novosphingobium sp.]|nr:pilus assembly protein CpaE [Novosphingobium sp.]